MFPRVNVALVVVFCALVSFGALGIFSDSKHGRLPSEYCCCTTDEVNDNAPMLFELLDRIVKHQSFRYLKVNLHKKCPYWAVSLLCTGEGNPCSVCKCDAHDVPTELLFESDMAVVPPVEEDPGQLQRSTFSPENAFGSALEADEEYVDLVHNPEAFTAYSGVLANRIWEAIYKENCFDISGGDQCSEKRFFYQLLSGLHASISTHLSVSHYKQSDGSFKPNCGELKRRVLDHPDRMDNLQVLYQFVLRATTRAASAFIDDIGFYSNHDADGQLRDDIAKLFKVKLLCSRTFNETKILESRESAILMPKMDSMLRNITTLMDCLSCEKCRVWGKLQTRGLATAFRILSSSNSENVSLSRSDRVALINLLRQLSFSVVSLQQTCLESETSATSDL